MKFFEDNLKYPRKLKKVGGQYSLSRYFCIPEFTRKSQPSKTIKIHCIPWPNKEEKEVEIS